MIQTINLSDFRDAFHACGRQAQFSYEGLTALFEFLEEVAPDFDLDVVALCCEYSEDTWQSIAANYGIKYDENENDDEGCAVVRDYLNDHTAIVAEIAGRFLYAQF
jgi:cytochrome oxidase Cu insertion factor (SCO1/SenC/PrrC family)